ASLSCSTRCVAIPRSKLTQTRPKSSSLPACQISNKRRQLKLTPSRSDDAPIAVKHRKFGQGKVKNSRRSGAELLVQFPNFRAWLPAADLEYIAKGPQPQKVATAVAAARLAIKPHLALEGQRKSR